MTIRDLAKYCGVSVTTVSYALNDSPEVSNETKAKIKEAAIKLNYYPSHLAKGLKIRRTNCIGVFVTGFEGTAHTKILSGLARAFRDNDKYQMLVTVKDKDLSLVRSKMVDLAIVMDATINNEMIASLAKVVPIVSFDKNISGENIYPTFIKNIESMYELTSLLINKGCKKIAYLLGSHASHHNELRFKGYLKALSENNIPFDCEMVYDADAFTKEAGFNLMQKVIKDVNYKLPFDALVASNDELAIGAIQALQDANFKVPQDIKVTGFDNITESSLINPSLTTIDVDWEMYGEKMGEYAFKILNQKDEVDNSLLINTTLIERESTK